MSCEAWREVASMEFRRADAFDPWDIVAINGEIVPGAGVWERRNDNVTVEEHKPLTESVVTWDGNLSRVITFSPPIDIFYDHATDQLWLNADCDAHWAAREKLGGVVYPNDAEFMRSLDRIDEQAADCD